MTAPEKKSKFKVPKRPKAPKLPKGLRPKRRMGPLLLILLALLMGGAAAAVYYVPIPGLTAPEKGSTPPVPKPATTGASTDAQAAQAADLAKRAAELSARDAALAAKESQVAQLLKDLTVQQSATDATQKVSAIYSDMAPSKAAPILAAFDVPTAARIMRLLPQDSSAAIFAAMNVDQAAAIMKELLKPQALPASAPPPTPAPGSTTPAGG